MTTTATGAAAPQTTSTGFELFEKMVGEQRAGGKSKTLDQWLTQVRQQLGQLKSQKPGPKVQKDIEAIEKAVALAAELVTTLAASKKT